MAGGRAGRHVNTREHCTMTEQACGRNCTQPPPPPLNVRLLSEWPAPVDPFCQRKWESNQNWAGEKRSRTCTVRDKHSHRRPDEHHRQSHAGRGMDTSLDTRTRLLCGNSCPQFCRRLIGKQVSLQLGAWRPYTAASPDNAKKPFDLHPIRQVTRACGHAPSSSPPALHTHGRG